MCGRVASTLGMQGNLKQAPAGRQAAAWASVAAYGGEAVSQAVLETPAVLVSYKQATRDG